MKHLAKLILLVLLMPASRAFSEESIDSLLHRADRALGGKKAGADEPAAGDDEQKPKAKSAKRKTAPAPAAAEPTPGANPTAAASAPDKPLAPIDQARVSEILAIDVQAKERERMAHAPSLMARVGIARDAVPAVYQSSKDDDTFTLSDTLVVGGPTLEVASHGSLGDSTELLRSLYWGLNAGAGYLQGQGSVARRGIQNEDRSYSYEILPLDAGALIGWVPAPLWQVWGSVGYGSDLVRQVGKGETDTFTSAFAGATAAVGASRRFGQTYEAFLQFRQRGLANSIDKIPTRSQLAGRVITAGIGVPVSG